MKGPQKKTAAKSDKKKEVVKKRPAAKAKAAASNDEGGEKKKPAKKAKKEVQQITEKDTIEKLWVAEEHADSYTFKIASFNVAGLRAYMKKYPNGLAELVKKHDLDLLCLQETKLQVGSFNLY